MPLHGFSLRFRRLASWLSLLALCSALVAPASVLAQEMQSGQWIALCGSGPSADAERHADSDGGHCDLCALPGLALPAAGAAFAGLAGASTSAAAPDAGVPSGAPGRPAIRGPPVLS